MSSWWTMSPHESLPATLSLAVAAPRSGLGRLVLPTRPRALLSPRLGLRGGGRRLADPYRWFRGVADNEPIDLAAGPRQLEVRHRPEINESAASSAGRFMLDQGFLS